MRWYHCRNCPRVFCTSTRTQISKIYSHVCSWPRIQTERRTVHGLLSIVRYNDLKRTVSAPSKCSPERSRRLSATDWSAVKVYSTVPPQVERALTLSATPSRIRRGGQGI